MSDFDPKTIQDQARDELLADPFFAAIPVISADPADLATEIQDALDRIGLGILLMVPSLHASNKNLPGPVFDRIKVIAEVCEAPLLWRTSDDKPTAQKTAMVVAAVLQHFAPEGINERFYVTDVVPIPDPTKSYNIWHIEMECGGGVYRETPQIAPVVAENNAGLVTLSCATPGAAIFYTLDGVTYPAPRNEDAALYLAPFAITDGTVLRARAWLAGYAPPTPPETLTQY